NDKAVVEIPSPVDGTVKEVKVDEGVVAVVGDVLITFDVEGEGSAPSEEEAPEQPKAADNAKDVQDTDS
ncbi:biotin/lipoyl-binding protein, partial [Bifidobacterium pseudocatenulatum]|nr:biotin/lipoyl-binding protein [Bifidobacterium pseudocatenulatum]